MITPTNKIDLSFGPPQSDIISVPATSAPASAPARVLPMNCRSTRSASGCASLT
jgi:hypothetical protein